MMTMNSHAQQTYFNTTFDEGMPEQFQLWDIDGRTPSNEMAALGFADDVPWVVTTEEKDGNHVAASTSWYKNAGQSNDWMVLPTLEISDAEAKLQWRSRAYDKDLPDGLKVYIGQWTDATTERGYLCDEDFNLEAPLYSSKKEKTEWTFHEVSLADYVGQTVYIAFVNDSKDKHMLFVDDIFVGIPSAVNLVLDFGRCYDGYGELTISGKALCQGTQPVNGFTVGFEMEGKTIEETFDAILEPGAQIAFTLGEKPYLERNATADYHAWIASGDDRVDINGKLSAFLWKVVAEEVTGTWCQYCVRGLGAMNYMRENYPDGFIGIGIHNDGNAQVPDSMAIPGEEYRKWIMNSYNMQGYPHCVLNRNAQYSTDPGNIPSFTQKIKQTSKNYYGLLLNATFDPTTNLISAHTDVYFANDFANADFKLAYIVIENDVHRTHADTGILDNYCGYDQVNGYAGGAMGECYGFENLPNIINADDIWYQDVARGYKGNYGFKGESDLFPKSISEGDHFTHDYELEMPHTVLKTENTELIVMLLSKSGAILNAEKCPIAQQSAEPTAVEFGAVVQRHTEPAVYDLQGRVVSKSGHSLQPGIYIIGGKKVVVK